MSNFEFFFSLYGLILGLSASQSWGIVRLVEVRFGSPCDVGLAPDSGRSVRRLGERDPVPAWGGPLPPTLQKV